MISERAISMPSEEAGGDADHLINHTDPEVLRRTVALRREISRSSAQEQLLFYHTEPLNVAAALAGRVVTPEEEERYSSIQQNIWWTP
jgi:hypothetical protein